MSASILVADDHDIARAGLITMIGGQDDFHVALDVGDGAEAVEAAALHKPDLALLDIRMPRMDGLAATREIRRVSPGTRVMIITMHDSLDYLEAAIEAGASGYLLKDASRDDILRTIRRVLEGDAFFDGPLVARLLKRAATKPQTNANSLETLTVREREVLSKVAEGLTNKEIGRALKISPGTVKIHVERIIAKLGAGDRTQAAVMAVRGGLVPTAREGQ
ncbi:response regulator transcription factor [Rhizobium sp. MC63]|uniref:DNA-binding NarL/FixJ family response regulator n=2 Tax=Rhizobium TaxID=379 RepID=A0A7W8XFI5_9HYPH|nr:MULTISPECIES: response regulator transcription factor [Rhizobium]MBB5550993.1 DNA-binding NarL/FixJ family response regulator [Rhizobium lentis]MBB5561528.1 DNA-binding NarL/FixJ family response regulator [Rhizobium lentis]MBB5568112.1 DNA-binding NarL/FixJ family response regulator [Rhizobium lentis]MDF0699288.1 response regulator transcription factor [Rhizobium sp. MC63]MEA3519606.1 response regulator transcription factor [Rhizobium sp. MJ31]